MADVFYFYVYDDRKIEYTVAEPIMLEDNGITDFRFRIPKTVNGIDVSNFAWWFVYVNAAKNKYSIPLTLTNDEDEPDKYMTATYTVDYGMTIKAGGVRFAIEAINANQSGEIVNEWHTRTYNLTVHDTLQGNQVEYAETEFDIISALIVQIQQKYNALVGGTTPIPVASVSAMTDTSKIYLLTTDKNWYYYNGSAWVSGGLYASGIVIDPTLTQSGQAADAKVVGDIKSDFETITGNNIIDSWVTGYNLNTSGTTVDFDSPVQAGSMRYAKISCTAGDVFTVSARGATAARAWAFTDTLGNIVTRSYGGVTVENIELTAPVNGFLIINDYKENGVFIRSSYVGSLLSVKVNNIRLNQDSRTLINGKALTSFPVEGGAFTGLHPNSAVQPYYLGGLNSNYAEFDCTINSGQSDFWVGMQVDSDTSMKFIGINMRNADGNKLRRTENNTSSITVLNSTTPRTLLPVATTHVTMEVEANVFRIYCNGVLYSQFEIAESYTIKGLAFLNFGLADGNISNLVVYDTLEKISDAIITNDYISVTDDVVSDNAWTSFKDFPTNKIYGIGISTANYASLGFPISRAGLFMCIRPWDLASTAYNYRTYIYVCNDSYEFTRAYICFGHGTTVTPWASIDTYGGAGYKNPLAEAMMDNNNKVCFIGDSIIAGLGGTGYDVSESGGGEYIMYRRFDRYSNVRGYCWVNEMIQHMNDVYGHTNVKNRGVGGISTEEVYNNWATLLDGANTVVLSVGTNNYNHLERITTYLPQIVKECIKANVKLMVMTSTPNNTSDKSIYNAVKGRIVAVCNAIGIPVYDMYSEFETYLSLKGLTLSDVLNSDGIHPNDAGYAIMFEIAKKLFQI